VIREGILPQKVAREIRRIALGKAQLDGDKIKLLTKRVEGETETPLRTVRTAVTSYSENGPASIEEHKGFKAFVATTVRSAMT
jgi:hypothetical protein